MKIVIYELNSEILGQKVMKMAKIEESVIFGKSRKLQNMFTKSFVDDYPLYFSEILHRVTTLYGGKCNILGFLKIILVASPGALLWLKKP